MHTLFVAHRKCSMCRLSITITNTRQNMAMCIRIVSWHLEMSHVIQFGIYSHDKQGSFNKQISYTLVLFNVQLMGCRLIYFKVNQFLNSLPRSHSCADAQLRTHFLFLNWPRNYLLFEMINTLAVDFMFIQMHHFGSSSVFFISCRYCVHTFSPIAKQNHACTLCQIQDSQVSYIVHTIVAVHFQ